MPHDEIPADPNREAHIRKLVREFEKNLREQTPTGPVTLEQIEKHAQDLGEAIKERVQKEWLDLSGTGHQGRLCPCSCKRSARFVGLYSKLIVTRCGAVRLSRAYYYCGICRKGFCPLDKELEIGSGTCSVEVRALLSRFSSYLPFAKACVEMQIICGVRLSASTVRREALAVGQTLARDRAAKEQQVHKNQAKVPEHRPSRLQVSMDGVLIFVDGQWREVKCAVAYEPGHDEQGYARGALHARYYATLSNSAAFGPGVRTLAFEAGSGRCSQVGIVADGAEWIWQEVGKHFAGKVQVLDFYHACEHLWQVARARFGQDSTEAKEWMRQQKEHLLDDQVAQVIRQVQDWSASGQEHSDLRRRVLAYLCTHAPRMCYGSLRAAGWHIGSGVMEASCRTVVQSRMKGAGMRWSQKGAEAMLPLRAAWCNSEQLDFTDAARRSTAFA